MEYKVKAYNIWEVGQRVDENGHPHQEDALYPRYGRCTPDDRLFVLCDGMGGHDHGEIASSVVCAALSESVVRQLRSGSGRFRERIFDKALGEAYDALDDNDTGSAKKMGTTMAMLCLYDTGYFIAHIGDTRVYHIRPGDDKGSTQIVFSTSDHSLVNKLVTSGKMTLEEAQASTRRHVITRAMQPHMEVRPRADVEISSDISQDDYFLMATHGMLDNLSEEAIRQIFSREGGADRQKIQSLMEATANNRDNHSAVIVHIESVKSSRNRNNVAAASGKTDTIDMEAASSSTMDKMNKMTGRSHVRNADGSNFGRIAARVMIGILVLLSLVMMIYYAFIRKDEAMLEVGRASESPSLEYDPNKYEEEQYGYETNTKELIDDRVMDYGNDDVAEEMPEEEAPAADEPLQETPAREKTPEPASQETQTPEPVSEPDVPILQE